ncbi:MAG: Fic family protein [Candidatus Babeliales bacterium]
MRETGVYQVLGDARYFIPAPLPPGKPPFELSPEILAAHSKASFALGQLNEISKRVPDQQRFIKAYVIKEALLSSAIEGIHTTLLDVFTARLGEHKINKDTQLVLNYTKALDAALGMMQQGLPIANRIILKAHEELLSEGEGDRAMPGAFRKQSVRVGNLIPAPAQRIPDLMTDLERYINEPSQETPLIKAGLVHVQFETIHPFLDGNGRIGRLLIVLMLIEHNLLLSPILYPSLYFKRHSLEYYQKLDRVRTHGDFEGWILYYLQAIHESALDAYKRAQELEALEHRLKALIEHDDSFSRMRDTAYDALEFLYAHPVTTISFMSQNLGKAYNTIQNILQEFMNHGIVSEMILNKRNKQYHFQLYLSVLEKE